MLWYRCCALILTYLVATDNPSRLTRVEDRCETGEWVLQVGQKVLLHTGALDLKFRIQYAVIYSQALGVARAFVRGPQSPPAPPVDWEHARSSNCQIVKAPESLTLKELCLPQSPSLPLTPPPSSLLPAPGPMHIVDFAYGHRAQSDGEDYRDSVDGRYWPVRAKYWIVLFKLDASL